MTKDELIKELKTNNDRLKSIRYQLQEEEEAEKKLRKVLIDGISFDALLISKIISYLLSSFESKLYIPINAFRYDLGKPYCYLTIIPINEYNGEDSKGTRIKSDNQIKIYEEATAIKASKNITFNHLLEEYLEGKKDTRDNVFYCIDNFDDYPYIKEFISKLAEMQIINNGKHLTEQELLVVLSSFINSKIKQKTKELSKN